MMSFPNSEGFSLFIRLHTDAWVKYSMTSVVLLLKNNNNLSIQSIFYGEEPAWSETASCWTADGKKKTWLSEYDQNQNFPTVQVFICLLGDLSWQHHWCIQSEVLLFETAAFERIDMTCQLPSGGVQIHCSTVSPAQRHQGLGQLGNAQSALDMGFFSLGRSGRTNVVNLRAVCLWLLGDFTQDGKLPTHPFSLLHNW